MLNLIEEINVDLTRCKKVIDENNYLETVIAIEELQDKYRDKIKSLDEKSKDIVWNYSMKDLVNIKDSLIEYREEIIEKQIALGHSKGEFRPRKHFTKALEIMLNKAIKSDFKEE